MRKIIIAGNWKLNRTNLEAIQLVEQLKRELVDVTGIDIVVCPPFVALTDVGQALIDHNIALGAQDVYWEDAGAFTGEVSAPMLRAVGCQYVIIGHSERRQFFGETDESVNKKIKAALKSKLTPIVCVGENLDEREAGRAFHTIEEQLKGSLVSLSSEELAKIILAYEPVWAIGTGKTATPAQAQEVHKFIRAFLQKNWDSGTADNLRIQYGGSVKPDNAAELIAQPDIDGALVGGASLKVDAFSGIVKNCCGMKI